MSRHDIIRKYRFKAGTMAFGYMYDAAVTLTDGFSPLPMILHSQKLSMGSGLFNEETMAREGTPHTGQSCGR